MYNLTLKTAPTLEPLTVAEVEAFLRIDLTDDAYYLAALIVAARKYCENYQNRSYITQTWELSFDTFDDDVIYLPKGNLQSISSIKYTNSAGTVTTISSGDYVFSTRGILGRVTPAYGKTWPSFIPYPLDAIVIEYICGYGSSAANIPETVKQAMYLLISHWYENRVPVSETKNISRELEFSVSALLWQDRIIIM